MQKVTVLRKVALHLFVKKKQKWDKNLVEHHVMEWWLHARDGGCVRGMVAACEGWWLRARDGGCVRGMAHEVEGMAHEMEAGGTIQTLAQKVRARFYEQVHRTLP